MDRLDHPAPRPAPARALALWIAAAALGGCAPPVDVTDGHLEGELGDVAGLAAPTTVATYPGEGGRTTVELGVFGPGGEQLMLFVDLPRDLARRAAPGEILADGTLEVEPSRLAIASLGCSRVDPDGPWDVDRPAAGTFARVELTDDPAVRRLVVLAEFDVDGRAQHLEGWLEYLVPDAE